MDQSETSNFVASFEGFVIEPQQGWIPINFREVWQYRYMAYFLILRNLKANYQQSVLGPVWIILNNVVSALAYSMIFGVVADLDSEGVPYPLFTFTALMTWTLFSGTIDAVTRSMQDPMMRVVYFPRLISPLVKTADNVISFTLSLIVLMLMLLIYEIPITPNIIFFPVFALLALIFGFGVGLWFAPLQVRTRDVSHIMSYLTRFWFYATPVVYSTTVLPDSLAPLIRLNPITSIVSGFRWSILGTDQAPDARLFVATLIMLVILYGGLMFFRRNEQYVVDLS